MNNFSRNLKSARVKLGISQGKLADIAGVKANSISNYENGNSTPDYDILIKIVKFLGVSIDWIMLSEDENPILINENIDIVSDLSGKYDKKHRLQHIPLFRLDATAGIASLFMDDRSQKPIGHIDIPNLPKCDGATYVVGDSMYPLLKSGDIILYKKIGVLDGNIIFGEMYMLDLDLDGDDYITVKYIHRSDIDGHIKLVSQNQHHDAIDISISKVRGLALVKASIRFNTLR